MAVNGGFADEIGGCTTHGAGHGVAVRSPEARIPMIAAFLLAGSAVARYGGRTLERRPKTVSQM
jgi:hypothetical protein